MDNLLDNPVGEEDIDDLLIWGVLLLAGVAFGYYLCSRNKQEENQLTYTPITSI